MMTKTSPITNDADFIDSRDIIARIAHLEQLRQPGPVDLGPDDNDTDQDTLFAELAMLETIQNDCNWGDWQYGATLIRDSYFETYARELAEDIGVFKEDAGWPHDCIDWERATEALQQDYTQVEFNGVTYWIRS